MAGKENPFSMSMASSKASRQSAGEKVGPGSQAEDEVKLTVQIPESLQRDLKALAGYSGQSMKEILIRCIREEVARYKN